MVILQNIKPLRLVKDRHELTAAPAVAPGTKPSVAWDLGVEFLELIKLALLRAENIRVRFLDDIGHVRQAIRPGVGLAVAGVAKVECHHLEGLVRRQAGLKEQRTDD